MSDLTLAAPRKPKKLKLKEWLPSEEKEQERVFAWAAMMEGREPRLKLLHASMAGILTTPQFGAKLKRLGRKKGTPDLFLPVGHKLEWCGLFIELKRKTGGVLSSEQQWWLDQLTLQGYRAIRCDGADEAIAAIKEYLGMEG